MGVIMETKISIDRNTYSINKLASEKYRVFTHLIDGQLIPHERMFVSLKEAYDMLFLMTLQTRV
jgi:hypothetical protein